MITVCDVAPSSTAEKALEMKERIKKKPAYCHLFVLGFFKKKKKKKKKKKMTLGPTSKLFLNYT